MKVYENPRNEKPSIWPICSESWGMGDGGRGVPKSTHGPRLSEQDVTQNRTDAIKADN
jgi:hypothetical protein